MSHSQSRRDERKELGIAKKILFCKKTASKKARRKWHPPTDQIDVYPHRDKNSH